MAVPQLLKRRALPGAFLRSLGLASWAAEQIASRINFLGGHHQAPLSAWAGPARLTSTSGFTTIAVPLANGRVSSLEDATLVLANLFGPLWLEFQFDLCQIRKRLGL
jgi:DNA helicase-4